MDSKRIRKLERDIRLESQVKATRLEISRVARNQARESERIIARCLAEIAAKEGGAR